MSGYVEMLLYHGLDATGSLELSTTSDTGPWTKITLTSTKRINEALAEWTALADVAVATRDWEFYVFYDYEPPVVVISGSGGPAWVRMSPCLAYLLGFSIDTFPGHVVSIPATSDIEPAGMAGSAFENGSSFSCGVSFPLVVEESELAVYRAARAASLHYGRAREVLVDFYVQPDLWDAMRDSPLLSGHAAFWLRGEGTETAFGDGNLGGALTLYPLEPGSIEQDSPDDPVWIRLRCTMEEST